MHLMLKLETSPHLDGITAKFSSIFFCSGTDTPTLNETGGFYGMEWIEKLNEAITYMEEHLTDEIDLSLLFSRNKAATSVRAYIMSAFH